MKKNSLLLAVIAAFSVGSLQAATVSINGTEAQGTLGSMTVDGSGNVSINATSMTYQNGGTSTPPAAGTYTIGGTVSGLPANTSVLLKNNGVDSVSVNTNGPFAFPTVLSNTSGYAVTIATPPVGASCTLSNATGTVNNTNVTNVEVTCTNASTPPPPTTGACGALPSTVTLDTAPVNGKTYALGGATYSFPFVVRSGYNNYAANYTSQSPVMKLVWISSCPGGVDANNTPAPVSSNFSVQGYTAATLLVSGVTSTSPVMTSSQLTTGQTYYFNVRNATSAAPTVNSCTASNCPFVLTVPN